VRTGFILSGIILIALGAAAFMGKLDFTHDKEVVKIGGLSASVKEEKTLPQWLGVVGIAVGLALAGAGIARK
jgi:hypothetical protein